MNELQEVRDRLDRIEGKVDAVFVSAEKTRTYFKWTLIVTVATIVLPMIGLALVIPFFASTLGGASLDNFENMSAVTNLGF